MRLKIQNDLYRDDDDDGVTLKFDFRSIIIQRAFFVSGMGTLVTSPFAMNPFALPNCNGQSYATSPLISSSAK